MSDWEKDWERVLTVSFSKYYVLVRDATKWHRKWMESGLGETEREFLKEAVPER